MSLTKDPSFKRVSQSLRIKGVRFLISKRVGRIVIDGGIIKEKHRDPDQQGRLGVGSDCKFIDHP